MRMRSYIDIVDGGLHPMAAKKNLARTITAGFHSEAAAQQADADWARQFQKREMPESVEEVQIDKDALGWNAETNSVRADKLLVHCALADSATDAARRLKSNSVHIAEALHTAPWIHLDALPARLALRVGKRAKIAVIA